MVNYSDLQYLFESTDTNKPYNVDTNILGLMNSTTFASVINISAFLKNINRITAKRQATKAVIDFINTPTPTPSPDTVTAPLSTPTTDVVFTADATVNDVIIDVERAQTIDGAMLQKIIKELETSAIPDNVNKDHVLFRNFLYDIVEDVSKNFYLEAGKLFFAHIDRLEDSDSQSMHLGNAAIQFANFRAGRVSTLLSLLKNACRNAMKDIFNASTSAATALDMQDIGSGTGKYTRKFYYDLRDRMVTHLDVRTIYSHIDNNHVIYFKKIATDLFLKTAYPCVHLIYIQTLMTYYAEKGDFVNVRVMILASVYYVFYMLKSLVTTVNNLAATSPHRMTTSQETELNKVFTKLNEYLTNNNKIDVTSDTTSENEMKKLIVDLHKLSKDVSDKNGNIQTLKGSITAHQLAMRNVLYNLDVIRSRYWWASFEFWALFAFIIVFIISMSILLVLAEVLKKPFLIDWVQYICGFVALTVIVVKIIMLIVHMMQNNK
jgi:hypothetical protein